MRAGVGRWGLRNLGSAPPLSFHPRQLTALLWKSYANELISFPDQPQTSFLMVEAIDCTFTSPLSPTLLKNSWRETGKAEGNITEV